MHNRATSDARLDGIVTVRKREHRRQTPISRSQALAFNNELASHTEQSETSVRLVPTCMRPSFYLPSVGGGRRTAVLPSAQWVKPHDARETAGRPARNPPAVRKHLREICVVFARFFSLLFTSDKRLTMDGRTDG